MGRDDPAADYLPVTGGSQESDIAVYDEIWIGQHAPSRRVAESDIGGVYGDALGHWAARVIVDSTLAFGAFDELWARGEESVVCSCPGDR